MTFLDFWNRCAKMPGGRWLFRQYIRRAAPYSASIYPHVLELRPGYARISITERRALKNPFNSVHAVALLNLCELTSGLAVMTALPPHARGIVTSLSIDYFKKARGVLTSSGQANLPVIQGKTDYVIEVAVTDAEGDVVCKAKAIWALSPKPT